MQMRAARMHGYNEPLRLEEIPVPDIGPEDVLVKVAATGMCRSDCQLIEGYFTQGAPLVGPITPGHEVAGRIAAIRGATRCGTVGGRLGRGRGDIAGRAVIVFD
jgi:alcohol dehydrogenase, propanol-preferring